MRIAEEIRELVCERLRVRPEDASPEARLTDDLGADSLDIVALFMAIERSFAIRIPNEHFPNLLTLNDVTDYVATRATA